MSREWKPGDVAISEEGRVMRCSFAYGKGLGWVYDDGSGSPDNNPGALRSLVVIDPEDRKQVEQLRDLWGSAVDDQVGPVVPTAGEWANAMQAALREFANPTPPEPEQPTGAFAVVQDRDGARWLLAADADLTNPWNRIGTDIWANWAELDVATVLSEGVAS